MIFENPTFSTEPNESEHRPVTPIFLQEQIRLPKDQWNEKFRQLIEEKTIENQQAREARAEETEESPEVLRERTFKRYMDGLGLDEETMRGKKILDLGSGEGEFIQSLIEKGIAPEAYGIDVQVDENLVENKLKGHLLQGNFEEGLPVRNVDYIVSVGAVSNGVWGGEEVMNIKRIIKKSLASLKKDGEIRIYPIQEAAEANPLEGLKSSQKKMERIARGNFRNI